MWLVCLLGSVVCLLMAFLIPVIGNKRNRQNKRKLSLLNSLFIGAFVAGVFLFFSVNWMSVEATLLGGWRALLLSAFHTMQMFTVGCDFSVIEGGMICCPDWLDVGYQVWAATLFVLAPIFTFGFVLSLFKNLTASIRYFLSFFKPVYIFSELNEKSLALARDLKKHHKKASFFFTDVFEDNEESTYELVEEAKKIGAVCFKKDILAVNFKTHSSGKPIYFFAIGENETENLNQALKLIENYKNRDEVHLYVFSTKIESQLMLTAAEQGKMKVRRINKVQSLISRALYDQGDLNNTNSLFDRARETENGNKKISAVVVGLGRYGKEMVKALAWFGQMDGYELEINAFDKDPLAKEKFEALAPDLMSEQYNGHAIAGEARYKITIHSGMDMETSTFFEKIKTITDATYVLVALGDDDANVTAAVNLRVCFERMGIQPTIQAIVYNDQQKKALSGIENFKKQPYDIEFIGDIQSSYSEDVILDSDLEENALQRHLKYNNNPEEFWSYEYNYRSSMASAIHMKARIKCGIPGAGKREEELTGEEKHIIEVLEHRRWNAYMRAEGYIYSGSEDPASRNDLGKMHHNLVAFASLTEEDKRKDSRVASK